MILDCVIDGLLQYARPEILKEFRADSCIASSAIGIDVLSHFGFISEPFPVQTIIFNQKMADKVEKFGMPQNGLPDAWVAEGAWSVGVGFGAEIAKPGKWQAGHLNILAENRYLIDLSIDQATRPQYQIDMTPFCIEVSDDFIQRNQARVFKYNDCFLRIVPFSNHDYSSSPDWCSKLRRANVVRRTIEKIEKEYSHA